MVSVYLLGLLSMYCSITKYRINHGSLPTLNIANFTKTYSLHNRLASKNLRVMVIKYLISEKNMIQGWQWTLARQCESLALTKALSISARTQPFPSAFLSRISKDARIMGVAFNSKVYTS